MLPLTPRVVSPFGIERRGDASPIALVQADDPGFLGEAAAPGGPS